MEYHGLVGHLRLVMLQCKVRELSGTESLKCFSCHQLIILHRTAVTILNLCVGERWGVKVGYVEVGCVGVGCVEVGCVGVGCVVVGCVGVHGVCGGGIGSGQ